MNFGSKYCYHNTWQPKFNESLKRGREDERDRDRELPFSIDSENLDEVFTNSDTNVVALSLGTLGSDKCPILIGEIALCSNCRCAITSFSSITMKNDHKMWKCDFCGTSNALTLDEEEIPKTEAVDYLIEPAPVVVKEKACNTVVFCIDISGSMCVTTTVPSSEKFPTRKKSNLSSELGSLSMSREDQYLPSESRHDQYVSTLECVQTAIGSQIDKLLQESPDTRVAIVTFNNEVKVISPDALDSIIAGDKLSDYDELVAAGKKTEISQPIKNSHLFLQDKLWKLEESGCTALGPALLVSLGICLSSSSSSSHTSKIILATDGLANCGVGAMDNLTSFEEREKVEKFYEKLGELAKENAVSISVLSIPREECKLENLGKLAALTAGNVDIVDPLSLARNFSSILTNKILATKVSIQLMLHPLLFFKSETRASNTIWKDIGNVTKESDFSFSYGIKPLSDLSSPPEFLPFQAQIRYTTLDGAKCMRVISKKQPVTTDRELAEKNSNLNLLGVNYLQEGASLAHEGHYRITNKYFSGRGKVLNRIAKLQKKENVFTSFNDRARKLETVIEKEKDRERDRDSDRRKEYREHRKRDRSRSRSRSRSPQWRKMRAMGRSDVFSNEIYQMKNTHLQTNTVSDEQPLYSEPKMRTEDDRGRKRDRHDSGFTSKKSHRGGRGGRHRQRSRS